MLKRYYLLYFILFSFQVNPLDASSDAYDSLSIKGAFDLETNRSIIAPFKDLFTHTRAQNEKDQFYFTPVEAENMHVSITIVEPAFEGAKLTSNHLDCMVNLGNTYLDVEGGYNGTLYGLYLLTNGYDAGGENIHHAYSSYDKAFNTIRHKKYGYGEEGNKCTRAHIVLRYGTNGVLKQHAESLLKYITDNKDLNEFQDTYEDREFTAHATLGVIKSFVGAPNENHKALSLHKVLSVYQTLYEAWSENFNPNQNYHLSNFTISGAIKKNNRVQYTELFHWEASQPQINEIKLATKVKMYVLLMKHYNENFPKQKDYAMLLRSNSDDSWGFPNKTCSNPSIDGAYDIINETFGMKMSSVNSIGERILFLDNACFVFIINNAVSIRDINRKKETQCRALPVSQLAGDPQLEYLTSRGIGENIRFPESTKKVVENYHDLILDEISNVTNVDW